MRTPRDATPSDTIPRQSSRRTSSEKRSAAPFDGRRVKAAIVGTGALAGGHLPALAALAALAAEGGVEIVAAVDIDAEAVKRFCAEGSVPHACTDLDRMLAQQRPDLVSVCTPHDVTDGQATLVFAHAPENDHTGEGGAHPAHWFVRHEPFAAVVPSFAVFDELELAPGDTLTRRYRVVVADGAREREEIAKYLEERPW